jgi:hypothetical protein
MSSPSLEELYKEHPWKTLTKFAPIARKHGFELPEIKRFLKNEVVHDQKSLSPEYLPIFSRIPGAYQFDTLVNKRPKGTKFPGFSEPKGALSVAKQVADSPYFLVFTNINTRKGYAYPMPNKTSKSVLKALESFNSEASPKVLRSDQDSAYLSDEIRTYLKNNNIGYSTTNDEDHNTLGIINRFIRTIRDLGGEKPLTKKRMQKLIATYNNTVHSSINMNPNDMNEEAEKKYIDKKIEESEKIIKRRKKYSEGTKVRIKNDDAKIGKKRSNVTPQAYTIEGREGNQYLIKSIDGSIDKVPYFRIVPAKGPVKLAETIKEGKRGIVEKILGYDAKTDKYQVVYSEGTKDKIPAKNLREGQPLRLSVMERRFWVRKGNPPVSIKKWQ